MRKVRRTRHFSTLINSPLRAHKPDITNNPPDCSGGLQVFIDSASGFKKAGKELKLLAHQPEPPERPQGPPLQRRHPQLLA